MVVAAVIRLLLITGGCLVVAGGWLVVAGWGEA